MLDDLVLECVGLSDYVGLPDLPVSAVADHPTARTSPGGGCRRGWVSDSEEHTLSKLSIVGGRLVSIYLLPTQGVNLPTVIESCILKC